MGVTTVTATVNATINDTNYLPGYRLVTITTTVCHTILSQIVVTIIVTILGCSTVAAFVSSGNTYTQKQIGYLIPLNIAPLYKQIA